MRTFALPLLTRLPAIAWTYKFCQFMVEQSGIAARVGQTIIVAIDLIWM